jgi:hypothetical protein
MWFRRAVLATGLVLLVGVSLSVVFFKSLVRAALRPGTAFDATKLPVAPNFAVPAAWSALPTREDVADVALPALPAIDQKTASADVFYVHPTSYIGSLWNGPIDDARLNADTDRVATKLQASAFNACSAIYAPRYRQANLTAFIEPSADGQRALDVAYSDVAAAFRYYVQHHNLGRPFVVAAHSQGSVLAYRLLREEISGKPLRSQLIAAYLVGAAITKADLAQETPDLPACETPEQTGCVIGWNARAPSYVPGDFEMVLKRPQKEGSQQSAELLCVNPISYRTDGEAANADQNQGALFWDAKAPAVMPRFASAQCKSGTLVVSEIGSAPRDFMSSLLDRVISKQNYHPIEYQIFYLNLRHNATQRVDSYLKQHSAP